MTETGDSGLDASFQSYEPCHETNCLYHMWTTKVQISLLFIPYANNKGADQPAHPQRTCISVQSDQCPYCLLPTESIIPIHVLAKSKISRLQLVSVAEQAGLGLTWSQTQWQVFLWSGLYYIKFLNTGPSAVTIHNRESSVTTRQWNRLRRVFDDN